jgi:hypothetical protein
MFLVVLEVRVAAVGVANEGDIFNAGDTQLNRG